MSAPYWAVVGRAIGDDEDSCLLFEGMPEADAVEQFINAMVADPYGGQDYPRSEVKVTWVLGSAAPINIENYDVVTDDERSNGPRR